jgi:extradiol dioxygenase family protein
MAVQLDHTIVPSKDKVAGARFLTSILGLSDPAVVAHFVAVRLDNGVTLDYDDSDEVVPAHFAFLVGDEDFDQIFDRIRARQIAYFADPGHRMAQRIRDDRGRGFYFSDPDGHNLEVLTAS